MDTLEAKFKVCMLAFAYYPSDVRIRREAETLADKGYSVSIVCLFQKNKLHKEVISNVKVYRLPLARMRRGILLYLWQYFVFILLAFYKISMLHARDHFDVIHVHNMPEIIVLCAVIPKMTGAKIVLDLHDPMPEIYMAKYSIGPDHFIIRVLKFIERLCIRFANLAITPNKSFRDLFISRGCPENKIHIVMNSPQEKIFLSNSLMQVEKEPSRDKKFKLMFHGSIFERHGLDILLDAVNALSDQIPGIELYVYGTGDFVERFLQLRHEYKIENIVHYYDVVSIETIAAKIKTIDLGIIPNRRNKFTEINMPTRIFEYLCLGKPVIVPRTRGILDYFKDNQIHFFDPDDPNSLRGVILDIYNNPEKNKQILYKGMEVYQNHTWKIESEKLLKIVNDLLQQ